MNKNNTEWLRAPTEPGWWWYCDKYMDKPTVTRVRTDPDYGDTELRVIRFGSTTWTRVSQLDGKWSPFTAPEAPSRDY